MGIFDIFGKNIDNDALALVTKGDQEFEMNNFSNAINFYNKAIEKDKSNWYSFFKRGKSYQLSNNFDKAISDYSQGVSLDDNYDNNNGLGECYLMKSDFARAEEFLLKAYARVTKLEQLDKLGMANYSYAKAALMNNLAVAYYNLGNKQKALDCTDRGIEFDRNYGGNYGIKGSILLEFGHIPEALEYLKIAAKLGDQRAAGLLRELL